MASYVGLRVWGGRRKSATTCVGVERGMKWAMPSDKGGRRWEPVAKKRARSNKLTNNYDRMNLL